MQRTELGMLRPARDPGAGVPDFVIYIVNLVNGGKLTCELYG